jgi:serine protease AprX
MAPAAHLINLKVLDSNGAGEAADVIEAIDWAVKYRRQFGIRVINLSLGAAPTQSYKDDPICQAVERAAKAGIVVVTSAGNAGQTPRRQAGIRQHHHAGIRLRDHGRCRCAPRALPIRDDEIAPWSSKGPTMIDHIVKPDLGARFEDRLDWR